MSNKPSKRSLSRTMLSNYAWRKRNGMTVKPVEDVFDNITDKQTFGVDMDNVFSNRPANER